MGVLQARAGRVAASRRRTVGAVHATATAADSVPVSAAVVGVFTAGGGGGAFNAVPPSVLATIPGGSPTYTGTTSLDAALTGMAANSWLVLNYNTPRVENVSVSLASGVTVIAGPGFKPWIDGSFQINGGAEGARIFGLNVKWSAPDVNAHMIYLDSGSPEWAYSECTMIGNTDGCFALMRPGQSIHDWRVHHTWLHDNPGVTPGIGTHNASTDHCIYTDATVAPQPQNGRIDHCLIEGAPRGRNIKIGGPSGGNPIDGISVDHCTLKTGYGPSNGQVSNGATNTTWDHLILIDSGATTSLTDGTGSSTGNTYTVCRSDRVCGDNTVNFANAGGCTDNIAAATLGQYATQGAAGYGHLAP